MTHLPRGCLMRSFGCFLLILCVHAVPLFGDESALAVFRQRIEPIWKSPKPSSCSECHLSGVDLKDYLREDQAATFAALREAGLIDLEKPDDSKLLKFISRQPERPSLVTAKIRQQEFEALRAWIRLAVKDPALLKARTNTDTALKLPPVEIIRHTRQDHVLKSFVDSVWSEAGRCAACHSPDRNAQQRKKHGEKVSWIKPGDPAGTLAYMLEAKLIDVDSPEDSLLILKPTMQVPHGGGQKLEIGDRTYKQFMAFLTDYGASVQGKYQKPEDLPKPRTDVSRVSDIWLKIEGVPETFDKKLLRVDVFRKQGDGWSDKPWATGDRAVFGKGKLWQQHLTVIAEKDSKRAKEIEESPGLPPGAYLIRIYVDREGKLKKDPTADLGATDLIKKIEVSSRWPEGYNRMTIVKFTNPNDPRLRFDPKSE